MYFPDSQVPAATPDYVLSEIARIASVKHDYEIANEWEVDLYCDLLRSIAAGSCADPVECARIALTSKTFTV